MKTTINGKYHLELPEGRAKFWLQNPDWEKERLAAMLALVKDGSCIVDIGAELGDITALLALAAKDTNVYAIEPVDRMWPSIRTIFDMNNLPAPHCFVGFAGRQQKNDGKLLNEWPVCAYGELIDEPGFQFLDERWDLPVIAIDDLGIKPDIITMDIEGAELQALRGAAQTLKNNNPAVFISVHPAFMRDRWQQSPGMLHEFMESLGYKVEILAEDHEIHEFWSKPV